MPKMSAAEKIARFLDNLYNVDDIASREYKQHRYSAKVFLIAGVFYAASPNPPKCLDDGGKLHWESRSKVTGDQVWICVDQRVGTALPTKKQTKLDQVFAMISKPDGATQADIMAAMGWQAHTTRAALSAGIPKRFGCNVVSFKTDTGARAYRVAKDEVQ